ncbi:MAG TPA: hypothetical protein PK347_11365 [Burkholderiaceae bacterium]|nr:hypothetical protein [Burkholderiaceae bacterium]
MNATADNPIPLTDLLPLLAGGDRRSIGQANRVATIALEQPGAMAVLMQGMAGDDPVISMRCADAAEKASAVQPSLLNAHKALLLGPLATKTQPEVRWHVAPMLTRLMLSANEVEQVLGILLEFTRDASRIVQTTAMQALADLAAAHPHLETRARLHIAAMMDKGSPAVRARGRKLLATLSQTRKATAT